MSDHFQNKARSLVIATAPIVLLAAALAHPFLGNLPGTRDIAEAAADGPIRWGTAHLLFGAGIALALLLFFAVRAYLRDHENLWSFWSTPLVTIGLALSAFMVGAEGYGGAAAAQAGDSEPFFEELESWALPTYLTANVLLTLGLIGFATAIARARILGTRATWLVVAGAVIAAVGLFLPVGWGAHVVGIGLLLFAWPVAYRLWVSRPV